MVKRRILDYSVIIRPDHRTGTNKRCFSAYCPTLDVYSEGDTIEEALRNIKGAIELKLSVLAEDRQSLPTEPAATLLTKTSVAVPHHFSLAA